MGKIPFVSSNKHKSSHNWREGVVKQDQKTEGGAVALTGSMTKQWLVQTLLESNMLWIFPGAPVKALKRVAHVFKC